MLGKRSTIPGGQASILRMARIGVAELYELIRVGAQPVIVDVRSLTARALEPRWIPGAIHVPVDAVDQHMGHLSRNHEIVLYCTCPSEASAARVAKVLINHGFKRVRPLFGGLDAWIAAGYGMRYSKLNYGPLREAWDDPAFAAVFTTEIDEITAAAGAPADGSGGGNGSGTGSTGTDHVKASPGGPLPFGLTSPVGVA